MSLNRLLSSFKKSKNKEDSLPNELDNIEAILKGYKEDPDGLLPEEDDSAVSATDGTRSAQNKNSLGSNREHTGSKSSDIIDPDNKELAREKGRNKLKKKKSRKEAKDIGPDDLKMSELNKLLKENEKDLKVNLYDVSGKKELLYQDNKEVKKKTPVVEKLSQEQLERISMLEEMSVKADADISNVQIKELHTEVMTSDDLERTNFSSDDTGNSTDEKDDKGKGIINNIVNMIEAAPMLVKIIIISVIGVIIIALIITTIILASKIPKEEPADTIAFHSNYVTNGANYIYLNKQATLNDKVIVLQRMQVDALATVFYFNVELNNTFYEYTLIDDNGRVYNMDFAYLPTEGSSITGTRELRFEPIQEGVKSFTLTITDIQSNSSVVFDILFDTGIVYPPAKYIDIPIIISDTEDYSLELSNARFSSTGSILNFRLTHKYPNQGVRFLQKMMDDNIKLYEASSRILQNRKDPVINQVSEDGTFLMQLSYSPLRNLETKLSVLVQNIFTSIPLNQDIEAAGLFANTLESEMSFDIGGKKLILERMGMEDNIAVLVLHSEIPVNMGDVPEGEEEEYIPPPPDGDSNRVETRLDVELIAEISPGVELVFKSEQYSERIGTDLVFNLGNSAQTVAALPKENLKLRISNVYFKADDVEIPVELSKYKYVRSATTQNALDSVIDAFNQRLLHKSGLLAKESIVGFTADALESTIEDYTPYNIMVIANKPLFSAQVISYSIVNDRIYAIVQENWKLGIENLDVRFYRKHEVVARKNDTGDRWTVIYDKIKR